MYRLNLRIFKPRHNQGHLVVDQDPAQAVAVGDPIPGNVDDATHPPVQVVVQGPNQAVLNPAQPVPPVVAAVLDNIPDAALPGPPQPPVPAPGPVPLLVAVPLAVNGNLVGASLIRTLYGIPNILVEEGDEGDGEGEEVQCEGFDCTEKTFC
ncbi:hypothetical protein FRC09_007956 [Ceratobasidium sp. 395]|nr:hypothetical protein FRC09_007956 [Ceratobasidium sp. 395]